MKRGVVPIIVLCLGLLGAGLAFPLFPNSPVSAAKLADNPCGGTPNTWSTTSLTGAPDGRSYSSGVWTGTEMLVWGGSASSGFSPYFNSGGRYNPTTNTWAAMSTVNAPPGRVNNTVVWTGTEMLVWGGIDYSVGYFGDGGRYNPVTDTWTPISSTNAPLARAQHIAVWTGEEMIVWGGHSPAHGYFNDGGRYNPATDTWSPLSTTDAPSARFYHTSVWSGNEMIIWGGRNDTTNFESGGKYDPWTDTWTPTNTLNSPWGRHSLGSVWTGTEMIIWGGRGPSNTSSDEFFDVGGRYDPVADTWTLTSDVNAPEGRAAGFSLVWTGAEMIVWGGDVGSYLNTGGRYNPLTDSWTATPLTDAPSARQTHVGVWADSEMIIWGGDGGSLNTGGRLFICPSEPSPTPRPTNTHGPTLTRTSTPTRTRTSTRTRTTTPVHTVTGTPGTPTRTPTTGPTAVPGDDDPVIESFTINGGALTTTTINVNLLLTYSDINGDLQDTSVSNDNATWSDWDDPDENIGWTLPLVDGTKTVYVRARDAAGHTSAVRSASIVLDTSVESEYSVSINQGALYTNQEGVSLRIGSKGGTSQMQVSNDGGFVGAAWEPYTSSRTWEIIGYDGSVIPRTVYLRYRDSGGNVVSTASDDIILDVNAPTGSVAIGNANTEAGGTVTLKLNASDDLSGVGAMRISNTSDFQATTWISFAATKSWTLAANQVAFVQFRDNAGNISKTYATTACTVKPAAPQVKKPKNGASVKTTEVLLDWKDSKCGTSFTLVVKMDRVTGKTVGKLTNSSATQYTTKTLKRNKTYYWQVKVCNPKGCMLGPWWSFKITK